MTEPLGAAAHGGNIGRANGFRAHATSHHLLALRRNVGLRSRSRVGRWHRELHRPRAPWRRATPASRSGRQEKHDTGNGDGTGNDDDGFAIHTQ